MQRFISTLAIGVLAAAAAAQTVVLPNGYTSTVATGSNSFPWSTTANAHIQWIYDSTNFTLQGVSSPIVITAMRFRADDGATTVSWTGGTYPNVVIDVGTAAVDYTTMTNTYANNRGTMTNVLTGAATVIPGTCNGAGVPSPWYVDIPFATPVLYDPTSGVDLLIDVLKDQTGWVGGSRATEHAATLVKRCYLTGTTALTAPTGTVDTTGPVIEFTYTPAAGLYPAFQANVTTGNSPLSVNFTDQSYSSAMGGVLAWQWDLDGDSIIDSTVQNPTFVYNSCGTYNVSLTVVDAQHPTATLTKTGYIVVDPIAANFTASVGGGFAPLSVNFTDTSTGPIAAWQWDFDGDNVIDSTLQNPSWIYGAPGTYTVSLTIVNACRFDTRTRTNLISVVAVGQVPAPPEILQYQFNEVRGQEVANTATTNAMAAVGTVTGAWQGDPGRPAFRGNEPGFGMLSNSGNVASQNIVNTNSPLAITGSMSISWWQRLGSVAPGTTLGYTFGGTGPAVRCFTGGVAGTSLWYRGSPIGDINATYNVQNNPGVWEHVCLVIDDASGVGTWYFNGVPNTVTNFTPNTHTYTITQFHWGYQTTTSSGYSRYYDTDDVRIYSRPLSAGEVLLLSLLPENASAGATGTTCPGTLGTVAIGAAGGNPTLGNASFAVTLSNAEDSRLAALVFGFTPATFGLFDLSPWLGAGCQLGTDPASMNFYITAANSAQQGFPIPNHPSFAGLHVYAQWAVLGTQGATSKVMDINMR